MERNIISTDEVPPDVADEAFHTEHEWRGIKLEPWSFSRDALYGRLRAIDAPLQVQDALASPAAFMGDAAKILFIAATPSAALIPLRRNLDAFLAAVDEWSDQHIGDDGAADAMKVALEILNTSRATRAEAVNAGTVGKEKGL